MNDYAAAQFGGDVNNERITKMNATTAESFRSSEKGQGKAWYAKYLFRLGYGGIRRSKSNRIDRELIVTKSAPEIHAVNHCRSGLSESINLSLLTGNPWKKNSIGKNCPTSPAVNTLKQKMHQLATRQYHVKAEHLLTNINDQIAQSTQPSKEISSTVVNVNPSQSQQNHIKKVRKQELLKVLREILQNTEYMDGVKECDEILRSLPPIQPIRNEYVEKWLTESSSDLSNSSDQSKKVTELASSSSITGEHFTAADTSTIEEELNLSKSSSRINNKQQKPKTKKQKNHKKPMEMGLICSVHSCTCTLSSQSNMHGFNCPSGNNQPEATLEQRLFHVIPPSLSQNPEMFSTQPETLLTESSSLDIFDPVPRLKTLTEEPRRISPDASTNLIDDFEFPVNFNEAEKLQVPGVTQSVDIGIIAPEILSDGTKVRASDCIVDRPNGRRDRFYFRFRLNSQVRRKLSSYISKRNPFEFNIPKTQWVNFAIQPIKHENPAKITRLPEPGIHTANVSVKEELEIIPEITKYIIVPQENGEQPQSEMKTDSIINVVVNQNKELVENIANIFAMVQKQVIFANDDRQRFLQFIESSIKRKKKFDKTNQITTKFDHHTSGEGQISPIKTNDASLNDSTKMSPISGSKKVSKMEQNIDEENMHQSFDKNGYDSIKLFLSQLPEEEISTPGKECNTGSQISSWKSTDMKEIESSDNSAVYGTPRTAFAQSLLNLSNKMRSRKSHSKRDSSSSSTNIVVQNISSESSSVGIISQTPTNQNITELVADKPKIKNKENRNRQTSAKREEKVLSDKKLSATQSLSKKPHKNENIFSTLNSLNISEKSNGNMVNSATFSIHDIDESLNFYISRSISGKTEYSPPQIINEPSFPKLEVTEIACQTSPSMEKPTAAPIKLYTGKKSCANAKRQDFESAKALLGTDAFRINISDSTMVDSEIGMTFCPTKSNSETGNGESVAVADGNDQTSRLNVQCDAERMSDSELQEKLHDLQTENGSLTPLIELLEYLFYLLGLRGHQAEEDLFLSSCHVEDSMILWNAWKSKFFTAASPPLDSIKQPINMFALHSIDRLFHFLQTYCNVPEWDFTRINRNVLETNGDLKALYELFHSGVIEIPADRPKFFTNNVLLNRRSLRLFMMNMFRFDADGQMESVQRQKCLFYIHMFKNESINRPTKEQIAEYRELLQVFQLEEETEFSKTDELFIDIIMKQWLSNHELHHDNPEIDPEFQRLRQDTKQWLTKTTLINSQRRYGSLGALKIMATKYLKSFLGTMSHPHRTFISNILQIEQDPATLQWTTPDDFLEKVEKFGLEDAVNNYIVPYRFVGTFTLPNQKITASKKDVEREETFQILENICAQESILNQRLAQQAPSPPKADLKALSRTQFYRKQLKDPDIRKHLLGRRQPETNQLSEIRKKKASLYENVGMKLMKVASSTTKQNSLQPIKQEKAQRELSPQHSSILQTSEEGSISVSLTNHQRHNRQQRSLKQKNTIQIPDRQDVRKDDHHNQSQPKAIPVRLRLMEEAASFRLPVVNTNFLHQSQNKGKLATAHQTASDFKVSSNISRFVSAKLSQHVNNEEIWKNVRPK